MRVYLFAIVQSTILGAIATITATVYPPVVFGVVVWLGFMTAWVWAIRIDAKRAAEAKAKP